MPNLSDPNSRLPVNIAKLFPPEKQEIEKTWTKDFSFVFAADTQLGLIEKHILKKDNPKWDVDLAHLRCAISMINEIRPKPMFLVIGGDMVDVPSYSDQMDIHKQQYQDFKQCFAELDPEIKLICVCGNHDVGDVPTTATMETYRQEFGPEYYAFWVGGVKFVVINSQYFKFPEALPMEASLQNDFIESIKDPNAIHTVVFQHIPLFIEVPDEIDISFLNINRSERRQIVEQYLGAGVNYVFYGHTHRNGLSSFTGFHQILTAAVGGTFDDTKSGFRVVYVAKDSISHEYIPLSIQFKDTIKVLTSKFQEDSNEK